jgi:prepilin-type N-terminal cleavage/methylation domain-containing protein
MKRGFTLIELLLVIALIGIAVGVTTDILLSLVRSYSKTEIINNIEQNANFVSQKLEAELREAISASLIDSSTLEIVHEDKTVRYRKTNTTIERATNSSGNGTFTYSPLTQDIDPGGTAVSCGSSGCFTVTGTSPIIVSFSFVFEEPSSISSGSFSGSVDTKSTIVIRNTY